MGTWGDQPWECDMGAEYLERLLGASGFADLVADTLAIEDGTTYEQDIRAAAWVVSALAEAWPRERAEADLSLALKRLEAIHADPASDGEPNEALADELAVLRMRQGGLPDSVFVSNANTDRCCPFVAPHTEHLDLATPVVLQGELSCSRIPSLRIGRSLRVPYDKAAMHSARLLKLRELEAPEIILRNEEAVLTAAVQAFARALA